MVTELHENRASRIRLDCLPPSALPEAPAGAAPPSMQAEIGAIVATTLDLRPMLQRCAEAVLARMDAVSVCLWTAEEPGRLVAQATAGAAPPAPRSAALKLARLVRAGSAQVIADVQADSRLADRDWLAREGVVAFAAYPLLLGSTSLGALAIYTRQPLPPSSLQALTAVASLLAIGVGRQRAEQARSVFGEQLLAIVGHELRSPLSAITLAALSLQQRPPVTELQQRALGVIQRGADRMARLLQQVMDFAWARLGAGCALDRAPADLDEIARDVVAELQLLNAGGTFHLHTSGSSAGCWDRLKLAEVLSNLLSNAVQYGRPGRPISVGIQGAGDHVDLTVHNEGPPIPPELLPTIFDPFRRGASAAPVPGRKRASNLGLGLYIVREIVTAHGGTIDVTSTAQEGTTFAVHLPR
jgi:signal transduction histidine kinase